LPTLFAERLCAARVRNEPLAAVFRRRSWDYTEDCDSLGISVPLTEEAQGVEVSGFLFFVPFKMLKRMRQQSRGIFLRR